MTGIILVPDDSDKILLLHVDDDHDDQVTVSRLHPLGGRVPYLVFEAVVVASEKTLCVVQQLLEVRRGSISVNVIWHSTQRQLCGADDSVKPCLWRLHAQCCRAVI